MNAVIEVESATAEATVTKPAVAISPNVKEIKERLVLHQAPSILYVISLGGCSVAAIPNPNLFAKRGELAVAL